MEEGRENFKFLGKYSIEAYYLKNLIQLLRIVEVCLMKKIKPENTFRL